MFDPFSLAETNLRRAGWLLGLEILGGTGAVMGLSELGYPADLAIVAVWLLNVVAAWFIGKAAAAQGKSRWLYGLPALAPPIAVWLFFKLHSEDALRRLSPGSPP
ncbi:hypothetical protein HIV01_016360 [Lysobacter arenosi]|uniref:DUF805 domain-containing protein n=1 Tax=Lysobacter arenosi TaxID=2795387 RepID=A0ABX7R9C4_9GAMM|nr:hypothetical protein [Lysobacter arenosi]QSX74720.1 hypothetical protein HIV01_016360 [Lysobacter arenosi]